MNINKIKDSNLEKINEMLDDETGINVKFSRQWVEHEAAIFIQQELNKYKGIFDTSGIMLKDKGISFDGRIEVKNNANESTSEWIGYIDVQIKGTCVDKFKKGNSKFEIEVDHLENYTKYPLGVLLFVVQIEKDTLEKKIFYRNLLPVDLQKIFTNISTQESKMIDIYPIASNQKNMLKRKCLEFLKASQMQVGKRIVILDETQQPLEVCVQDFREDKNDYLKDKVYMYVKLHEDEGLVPAIMPEGGKFATIEIIDKPLILRGIKFYDYIKRIINDDEILFQYGDNVIYNTKTNKVRFSFQGSISEVVNDLNFALMLIKITNSNKDMTSILEKRLEIIKEFEKNLKSINIVLNDKFEQFQDIDYAYMSHFNKIMNNDVATIQKIDISRLYNIKLCQKNILLLLNRENSGIKVYNFFDDISKKITITIKKGEQYISICPYSLLLDTLSFEDILNYNMHSISTSIQNCNNNEINREYMNRLALSCMNSYDKTQNEEFYQLSQEFIDKLLEWLPDDNVYNINKLQLIRRKRNLNDSEISKIYSIKNQQCDNIELQYGIAILLENKSDINYYYNQFDEETKKEFSKYPIENLKNKVLEECNV